MFQSSIRNRADQLQKLETTTISNLLCFLLFRNTTRANAVNDENICTLEDPGQGICGGDSGSPLVWQGTVVGITSWMLPPCGSGPSVYVRVSHHLQWIVQQL